MARNNAKYAFGVLGLGVLVFFGMLATGNLPSFNQAGTGVNTNSFTSPPAPPATGSSLGPGDQLTITFNHRDALTEESRTEGTNVKSTLLYPNSIGGYTVVTTGSAQTYTMQSNSNGNAYIAFETQAAGQSHAFAVDRTKDANPGRFGECNYIDVEGDGNKEWVCAVSTAGLKSQVALSGQKPDLALNTKWYNEAAVSLNSPDNITEIGESAGTANFIEWEASGTAGDATFVAEVTLRLNSTSDNKWDAGNSYITIAGTQYSLASLNKQQDGTNTDYVKEFGYTLDKAQILEFRQNTNAKDDMTAKISTNFATNDYIEATLTIDYISEVEGVASVSDTVALDEAS